MEILDQLEKRISILLSKVESLSHENAALKDGQEKELESLADENHRLREELDKERARNSGALARVEALVERIKEQTDSE